MAPKGKQMVHLVNPTTGRVKKIPYKSGTKYEHPWYPVQIRHVPNLDPNSKDGKGINIGGTLPQIFKWLQTSPTLFSDYDHITERLKVMGSDEDVEAAITGLKEATLSGRIDGFVNLSYAYDSPNVVTITYSTSPVIGMGPFFVTFDRESTEEELNRQGMEQGGGGPPGPGPPAPAPPSPPAPDPDPVIEPSPTPDDRAKEKGRQAA